MLWYLQLFLRNWILHGWSAKPDAHILLRTLASSSALPGSPRASSELTDTVHLLYSEISVCIVMEGWHLWKVCFRVRKIIHPPGISLLDGPILKSFEVVRANSLRFCLVYLDGLHVGNYPSKICNPFWTCFGTLEIWCWSSVLIGGTGLLSTDPISYSDIVWSENPLKMTIFCPKKDLMLKTWLTVTFFPGG